MLLLGTPFRLLHYNFPFKNDVRRLNFPVVSNKMKAVFCTIGVRYFYFEGAFFLEPEKIRKLNLVASILGFILASVLYCVGLFLMSPFFYFSFHNFHIETLNEESSHPGFQMIVSCLIFQLLIIHSNELLIVSSDSNLCEALNNPSFFWFFNNLFQVTRIMEAEADSPYDILGVNHNMSCDNIKKRFVLRH